MFNKAIPLFFSLALLGCATVPDPWEGVPYQNVGLWQSLGVRPNTAMSYMANGFEPLDAKPWIQSGIDSPAQAVVWHRAGFTPAQANKWIQKGITVEQAIEYKKKGLTVE